MPKTNGRSPLWWNQNSPTTVQLFDLVVSGGVVGERHWNSDGFLAEILKRHLQLLTRSQSCQQVGGDRSACIAASRFAVWICTSRTLPSSTWSFAPPGRLSPSGN